MSTFRTDGLRALRQPLIALVLGLLPFVVFVGSSSTRTVNGVVVHHTSFNIAGIVLAIAGLVIAIRALASGGGVPRSVLSLAAAVLCALQIGISAGLYRFADLGALLG